MYACMHVCMYVGYVYIYIGAVGQSVFLSLREGYEEEDRKALNAGESVSYPT